MRKAEYKQQLLELVAAYVDKLNVKQLKTLIAKYAWPSNFLSCW